MIPPPARAAGDTTGRENMRLSGHPSSTSSRNGDVNQTARP